MPLDPAFCHGAARPRPHVQPAGAGHRRRGARRGGAPLVPGHPRPRGPMARCGWLRLCTTDLTKPPASSWARPESLSASWPLRHRSSPAGTARSWSRCPRRRRASRPCRRSTAGAPSGSSRCRRGSGRGRAGQPRRPLRHRPRRRRPREAGRRVSLRSVSRFRDSLLVFFAIVVLRLSFPYCMGQANRHGGHLVLRDTKMTGQYTASARACAPLCSPHGRLCSRLCTHRGVRAMSAQAAGSRAPTTRRSASTR